MSVFRSLPPIAFAAAALGLAAAALLMGLAGNAPARPRPVPRGDAEVAFIQTATSGSSWERFVAGARRAARDFDHWAVDDSAAFLDTAAGVPELVISNGDAPGKLRVRWYKLTSETNSASWVDALAARDPAPLAFIGGGSTDRALDLATALNARTGWHGDRPLLLITTATANDVSLTDTFSEEPATSDPRSPSLIGLYPGRSFRFCFTNRQMAQAVLDFLARSPDLMLTGNPLPTLTGCCLTIGGLPIASLAAFVAQVDWPPAVFAVEWVDDPFSIDLSIQFRAVLHSAGVPGLPPRVTVVCQQLPYSVGGYDQPNRHELRASEVLLAQMPPDPQRSLLILPGITLPARRLLRALTSTSPHIGRRIVAVTGDSIGFNDVYRDNHLKWDTRSVPVPLVLFTHQNPVAWDEPVPGEPPGLSRLDPPTSTDDVLLYADLVNVLVKGAFLPRLPDGSGDRLVRSSDDLANRLRSRRPTFFDAAGDRAEGSGGYVVVLRPKPTDGVSPPTATLTVWARTTTGLWKQVRELELHDGNRPDANP